VSIGIPYIEWNNKSYECKVGRDVERGSRGQFGGLYLEDVGVIKNSEPEGIGKPVFRSSIITFTD
jgi:hypothetical protein